MDVQVRQPQPGPSGVADLNQEEYRQACAIATHLEATRLQREEKREDISKKSAEAMRVRYEQRHRFLSRVPFISELVKDEQSRLQLVMALAPACFDHDDAIIQQGDVGNELYILEHGVVTVRQNGAEICDLYPGTTFGELALFFDLPRVASVVAKGDDCSVLVLRREQLFSAIDEETRLAMMAFARSMLLNGIPFFALNLKPEERRKIGEVVTRRSHGPGVEIVRQGAVVPVCLVLESGKLQTTLTKMVNGQEVVVEEKVKQNPGSCFGEFALLFDVPVQRTLVTLTEVSIMEITRESVASLLCPASREQMSAHAQRGWLAEVPTFKDLDKEVINKLQQAMQRVSLKKFEALVAPRLYESEDWNLRDRMILLESGILVSVPVENGQGDAQTSDLRNREHLITEHKVPGSVFQETAWLVDSMPKIDLVACTDCVILTLHRKDAIPIVGRERCEALQAQFQGQGRPCAMPASPRKAPAKQKIGKDKMSITGELLTRRWCT